MYKLGITGGIGSGKSTAARFLKKKGALVFDADEKAKQHLQSQIDLQNRIINILGTKVTRNGILDLRRLSEYVFSNKIYQETINKIMWPEVYTLIRYEAKKAILENADLFVVDAALILEAGYTRYFDSILLITASKSIRIKRIKRKKTIPDDQIEKRMILQMPDSEKKKLASTTIENNGVVQDLYIKLEKFYNNLNIG